MIPGEFQFDRSLFVDLTFWPLLLDPWVTDGVDCTCIVLRMSQGWFLLNFSSIGACLCKPSRSCNQFSRISFSGWSPFLEIWPFDPYNLTTGSQMGSIVLVLCQGCHKDYFRLIYVTRIISGKFQFNQSFFVDLTFDPSFWPL